MEQTSINRINAMHPKVIPFAMVAYLEAVKATQAGIHPFVTESIRSFERSDALYAQGRTKPGEIVTNAPGGSSFHNYGLALDFVILKNNVEDWSVNRNWMIVVDIFKEYGFKWGGEFKKPVDAPHFEMAFGYNYKQLLAKYRAKDFIPGTSFVRI